LVLQCDAIRWLPVQVGNSVFARVSEKGEESGLRDKKFFEDGTASLHHVTAIASVNTFRYAGGTTAFAFGEVYGDLKGVGGFGCSYYIPMNNRTIQKITAHYTTLIPAHVKKHQLTLHKLATCALKY